MNNLGVITQIEDYMLETVTFSAKRKENPNFLEFAEQKRNEEFYKVMWNVVFSRKHPISINDVIKSNINAYFERLLPDVTTQHGKIKGYNGWIGSLLDLDFILSYFLHKTELTENSELYQIIKEYYDFLKNQCITRNFEIPKPFDKDPLERFQVNKANKTEFRPPCPECESTKIVSVGVNWLCKDCGRQYRKNRRQT